jgi:multidrug efflux system outer membrane protein
MNVLFSGWPRWRWLLIAVPAVTLAACAWMQDDTPQKPLINPAKARLANDIHLAGTGWPAAQWWTRYDDPQLNRLIERALDNSPTIRIARARIAQARANVELARANERPAVIGAAGASRQWVHSNGNIGPVSITTPIPGLPGVGSAHGGTLAAAGAIGSYSLDVWGLESSVLNAAAGARNAALAKTAATELELATGIAQTYFGMQAAMRKRALLKKIRAILADSVAGMKARKARGLVTQTDVDKATRQLIEIKQSFSAANMQVIDLREALRALIGAGADDFPAIHPVALPKPEPRLPKTLSYSLLSHRPDLVAMLWAVQASINQVAAAKAAFYPSFNIKAFLGFSHINLDDIVNINSRQFSLLPGLTLPLFDGGRLNANLHKTRASSNELIEQYNQAVLNAVRDVAVAATNMQGLAEQTRLEVKKRNQIKQSIENANAHRERGLISRLGANQARIPLLKEDIQLAGTRGQSLGAEITLIKALGGGYDISPDKLPAPQTRGKPRPASAQ